VSTHSQPRLRRRKFLAALGASALIPRLARAGKDDSIAAAFDREVEAFMAARAIPGGALAVVKESRLVYAKGYGWADSEKRIRVQPDSLFRIASVSKPITATAVLRLVTENALDLDARAFELLKLEPVNGKKSDPRLARITIRQLLQHTGGWDREKSGDPMFRSRAIARSLAAGAARHTGCHPLHAGSETRFRSGSALCLFKLRLLRPWANHRTADRPGLRKLRSRKILAPIGIRDMRIGRSLDRMQAANEVRYYMRHPETGRNVFNDEPKKVPFPYGGFCLEAMDAHGGWLASPIDLARFAAALDEQAPRPLLKPETIRLMQARPPAPVARQKDGSFEPWYYGLGWATRPVGPNGKVNCWHAGSLPGTATLLVRRWDGLSWVVLFNQRSEDKKLPDSAIDPALHRAADAVSIWPTADLFSSG
jgi:CubicO group peptidase (beta-lactamase class C family)